MTKPSDSALLLNTGKATLALQAGQLNKFKAKAGEQYRIVVRHSGGDDTMLDNVLAKRHGDDLLLSYADGTQVAIENYYGECKAALACQLTLPGKQAGAYVISGEGAAGAALGDGEQLVYAHGAPDTLMGMAQANGAVQAALSGLSGAEITYLPASSSGLGLGLLGALGAGLAVAAGGGGGGGASGAGVVVVPPPATAAVTMNQVGGDDVINASEQSATITGTTVAGAAVSVAIGGNLRSAQVSGTTWSYTLTAADISAMGQGGETITATATVNGGASASTSRSVLLDTIAPAAPRIDRVAGDDLLGNGEQASVISGGAEAGADVTLSVGSLVRHVTADPSGAWSYTLTPADLAALGQGAATLGATATDGAGNVSAVTIRAIGTDTIAPAAPVIHTVASDDVINASEQASAISGSAEAGASIRLTVGGQIHQVSADAAGA